MRLGLLAISLVTLTTFSLVGCSAPPEDDSDANGGALNYKSAAAREYRLSTEVTVKLPKEVSSKTGDERTQLILEHAGTTRALVEKTIAKALSPSWFDLGIGAIPMQVRSSSVQWKDLEFLDDDRYVFTATSEFAGIPNLLSKLPVVKEGDRAYLSVPNDRSISPDVQNGRLKTYIESINESLDAYPRYLDLFEDGLDIAVHVGSDFNRPRLDIAHAHSLYEHLLDKGFVSPVSRFEQLGIDSPPLVRTIRVKDADVPVRVRIVHELMAPKDNAQIALIDAFKASAKTADVVIYDGHASGNPSFARLVLIDNPRDMSIELFAQRFKDLDLSDKQQIYFFNGCKTYSVYADALYANPARNPNNTDVISSLGDVTMYPEVRPVIAFIDGLVGISEERSPREATPWVPSTWMNILSRLNDGQWTDAYGVHGLDDNPRLSPLADEAAFGRACRGDAECGAVDSKCIDRPSGSACGLACADSSGCPNGTVCAFPLGQCIP